MSKASFVYDKKTPHRNRGVTFTNLSPEAQEDIRRFMADNYVKSPDYQIKRGAEPFLQGDDPRSGWMFVEFWSKEEMHLACLERLVEIFKKHHPGGSIQTSE